VAGSGLAALMIVSISVGSKNIAFPMIRQAPIDRARSRNVRSEIWMPAAWSFATAVAGEMASSNAVIPLPPIGRLYPGTVKLFAVDVGHGEGAAGDIAQVFGGC
jgi:hypothetical protein